MIIRPFLYDIKKTITSKTVLILVAIILLISLAIIPLTSIRSTGIENNLFEAPILYYHDPNLGSYHYLAYFSNRYGDPISGVTVTVILQGPQNYTRTVVTNSSGLAFVAISAPNASYYVTLKEEIPGQNFSTNLPPTATIKTSSPGAVLALSGQVISPVVDKYNASKSNIQVFYSGDYGVVPSSYSLYYKVVATPFSCFSNCFTEANMTKLGDLNSYREIFDPSIPPSLDGTDEVFFTLFNQTGTAVQSSNFGLFQLRQPRQPIMESNIASAFFSTILGLVIPLMAIIGSYSSYGKDRLTGVLESILARPVTRRGLAMSRFLSTVAAFTIASAAAVGVVDLVLNNLGGSFLDQSYVLAIIAGLVVEVGAFTGLIFLLSHLLKSTGALLGISIVLFIVLDFFWSLIIFLVTLALGGTGGSFVALQATYYSYYANPAQFLNLINAYVFQSSNTAVQASSLGVTLPAIVLDGLLWTTVPFILFLYLAVKRD